MSLSSITTVGKLYIIRLEFKARFRSSYFLTYFGSYYGTLRLGCSRMDTFRFRQTLQIFDELTVRLCNSIKLTLLPRHCRRSIFDLIKLIKNKII